MKIKWMVYPPVVKDFYVEHSNITKLESHEVESAVEYLISLAGRMLREMKICEAVELTQARQQQNGCSFAAG